MSYGGMGHVVFSLHLGVGHSVLLLERAFNQFTIACELDMINARSAADIS